jgi:FtsX extracellular domain
MKRVASMVLAIALAASCTSGGGTESQVRDSFCVHVLPLAAFGEGSLSAVYPATWIDETVSALRVDADLFQRAGDPVMASRVRNLASKIDAAPVRGQPDIAVFLDGSLTDSRRAALEAYLRSLSAVASVEYVSQEEAFARFKEQYKDNATLIENVTADALPASFEVNINDPSELGSIKAQIERQSGVVKVADRPVEYVYLDVEEDLDALVRQASCPSLRSSSRASPST